MQDKCKHCNKVKGNHQAKTLHCPSGSRTRIGYTNYSLTQVFEAKLTKGKKKTGFTL